MKTTFLRTLLAASALATFSSFAAAQELGFANMGGNWSGPRPSGQSTAGTQQAAYEAEISDYDGAMPGVYGAQLAYGTGYGDPGMCQNCSCMGYPYNGCSSGE